MGAASCGRDCSEECIRGDHGNQFVTGMAMPPTPGFNFLASPQVVRPGEISSVPKTEVFEASAPEGSQPSTPRLHVQAGETGLQSAVRKFSFERHDAAAKAQSSGWSKRYKTLRKVGTGQTAVVYEALFCGGAASSSPRAARGAAQKATATLLADAAQAALVCNGGEASPASSASRATEEAAAAAGRRVALKCFNTAGTSSFKHEVSTLRALEVHPNITRLLETFNGGDDGDALVFEYCDGGDLYDFYAANKGKGFHEAVVACLMSQLLLAINHLVSCRVDHRDVKPENMMLYGTMDAPFPRLKLADFGWAVVRETDAWPQIPNQGVGSLWYAPPELNPPVEGVDGHSRQAPLGKCDLWSVGIVAYLLLIGHSPFNSALKLTNVKEREQKVQRLAALGEINTHTATWPRLSADARAFIGAVVQPDARLRPTPEEALRHPFIIKGCNDSSVNPGLEPKPITDEERVLVWHTMDRLQQLFWLAVARAASEVDLLNAGRTFAFQRFNGTLGSYVEHLASELAVVAPTWFQSRAVWADVMQLAFDYLDVDGDGYLGNEDLRLHVDQSEWEAIEAAISNCKDMQGGIVLEVFRQALSDSTFSQIVAIKTAP